MVRAKKEISWSLSQIWNSCSYKKDRPLQRRAYVYASELSQPFCDRILKMDAVPATNPPNDRSRRKFLAGNLFEYLVKQILTCSGFYAEDEFKIDAVPYLDCLPVHGRADFKSIKGIIDPEAALYRLNKLAFPDYLYNIGRTIIESLIGINLKEKIFELKSVSSFTMDRIEVIRRPIASHTLQGYHYQKNSGIEAEICYLCRDDLRMRQFPINAEISEIVYRNDLEQITGYYKNRRKKPPIEPLAKFEEITGKFSKNLGIEWSPYLTMLYQFKTPDEYREAVSFVTKWNRTLSRYVLAENGSKTPTGKPIEITAKNKEIKAEILRAKYNFDYCLECAIKAGVIEDEIES